MDYLVSGPATISKAIFTEALQHHHSPALREVDDLWKVCQAWGVDSGVALGFFVHESSAGTQGAAVASKNWGNLRVGPGQCANDGSFAYYSCWAFSLWDFCKLLRGPLYEGRGLLRVSQVTPVYAPSADANDPVQYAAAVNAMCEEWQELSGLSAAAPGMPR